MYLRSTPRRNKDGSEVRYLQLAHNVWDPAAKRSRVQVLYNFGREDAASREALQRLAASVARYLEPGKARDIAAEGLEFAESRPLGGTWVLDALWGRLGIGPAMRGLLAGRRLDASAERVLFALAANRALAPSSKLAAARWVNQDVLVSGLEATTDDACYRAMDWLLEISGALEQEIFGRASEVLDLEVDLLFFDTTSTYFETEQADAPVARDQHGNAAGGLKAGGGAGDGRAAGFRAFGNSKDYRGDLPQVRNPASRPPPSAAGTPFPSRATGSSALSVWKYVLVVSKKSRSTSRPRRSETRSKTSFSRAPLISSSQSIAGSTRRRSWPAGQ